MKNVDKNLMNPSVFRLMVLFSFIAQTFRIPIIMYLSGDIKALELYLIVSSSLIGLQFYASEVILYRGFGKGESSTAGLDALVLIVVFFTAIFLFVKFGITAAALYAILCASLLAFHLALFLKRESKGPAAYVSLDFVVNIFLTATLTSGVLFYFGAYPSEIILLITAIVYSVFGGFAILVERKSFCKSQLMGKERKRFTPYLFQFGIMFATQLERLLIATISPIFLLYISVASGLALGWRRLLLDDSIIFSQLVDPNIPVASTVKRTFHTHWKWNNLMITGILFFYILYDSGFLKILPSSEIWLPTSSITIFFLLTNPFAITQVNLMRSSALLPSLVSLGYIGVVCCVLCLLLAWNSFQPDALAPDIIWYVLVATCSLYVVAFTGSSRSAGFSVLNGYHWVPIILMCFLIWVSNVE